jgi:hypothetical protein
MTPSIGRKPTIMLVVLTGGIESFLNAGELCSYQDLDPF